MKKNLLFITLLFSGIVKLTGQCTIIPSCTPGTTTGYCTTPSPSTSISSATVMTPYSNVIQLTIGSTVLISGFSVPITSATLTSVVGLPAGISYSINPPSGVMAGGASGCVLLSGTPISGTVGNYTVTANVSVATSFGSGPGSASWYLDVNPALSTGIAKQEIITNLYLSPNPTTSELSIITDSHIGKIIVIDALGKIVLTQDANYTSQTSINVSNLTKGIYFVQAYVGTKLITKKFIKE